MQYEKTVKKPTDPEAKGYQFEGWYTQENGGELFNFNQAITEDVTVYAHWSEVKPDPTVSFDCGGKAEGTSKVVQMEELSPRPMIRKRTVTGLKVGIHKKMAANCLNLTRKLRKM